MATGDVDIDFFEQIADGAIAADPDTGVIWAVNEALCELLGASESAICGSTLASYSVTDHRFSGSTAVDDWLGSDGDDSVRWTWPMETADGNVLPVAAHTTGAVVDGRDIALTTVRPLADRPERGTELAEARTQYRRILDRSSDYVVILSESGVVDYASPGVEALLDVWVYPRRQSVGRDVRVSAVRV